MVIDVSNNGFGSPRQTYPHDWTEGTGVIPAAGSIVIPAPTGGVKRKWFVFQNQSAVTLSLQYEARDAQGNTVFATMLIGSGGGVGTQGGGDERGNGFWSTNGIIKVGVSNAGAQVLVLEVLE